MYGLKFYLNHKFYVYSLPLYCYYQKSQIYRFSICHTDSSHKINFFSSFTFISLQTGKAPYYVGATQTLPRGHVYTDRSKGSIGIYVHKDMFISLLCVYAMKSRELFADCVIEKCD